MISATSTRAICSQRHKDREHEQRVMRRMYLLLFPIFLAASVLARMGRVFGPHEGANMSVVAEARSSAYAALGYAFNA